MRRLLGCGVATAMAVGAALHLAAATTLADVSGPHALVLVGMALACLPCATHVLVAPTRRTTLRAGLMATAMLAVHPALALLSADHAGHLGGSPPAVIGVGMVLAPAVTLCLAGLGTAIGRRPRSAAEGRPGRRAPGVDQPEAPRNTSR